MILFDDCRSPGLDFKRLTGSINFQDNLLNGLLTRSLPWEMSAPAP